MRPVHLSVPAVAALIALTGAPAGDEHRDEQEPSYAGVPLTRLETCGDTAVDRLRLTFDPRDPEVFSWASRAVGP